jgi:NADPH:quinone reductase-like Zn-dependent oxidoreductase
MLHRITRVKAGERILVHGAAGGVGTALLQLGSLLYLEMYGTASPAKQELVSLLGATPIDYTSEDFVARIRTLTGDGVDAVFDAIGGRNFQRSLQTLRSSGRLVIYGFSLKNLAESNLALALLPTVFQVAYWSLLPNGKHVHFYSVAGKPFGLKDRHPDWFREDLTRLFALLTEGAIKPVIAARLPLEDASRAHELIEHSQTQGKIVLLPNES